MRSVCKTKSPFPGYWGKGFTVGACLVVQVSGGGCRFVKFAWGANLALAGIGPRKPGRHVPVQVVDGVRVFCVRLGQFAGEDLLLLLEPGYLECLDRGAYGFVGCGRRRDTLVQRDLVRHVSPRL